MTDGRSVTRYDPQISTRPCEATTTTDDKSPSWGEAAVENRESARPSVMHRLVIAVDFDGVIHNPADREPGYRMGKPMPGAVTHLKALYQQGHELIVHTIRANGDDDGLHVERWLEFFGFPRMLVTSLKPDADVYLDDKAVRFTTWPAFMALVEGGGL